MYRQLGNLFEQEEIRKRNKDKNHCPFLKESANACESLPKNIGEAKKGQRCPNNPYVRFEDLFHKLEENTDIIVEASRIEGVLSLGAFPTSLDEITPIEYQVALVVKNFMDERDLILKNMSNLTLGIAPGGKHGNN